MSVQWFSSDLHLGDPRITRRRYCGDDVAKHDAWLAARWDAKIKDEDDVWLLGDVVAGMSLFDLGMWLRERPGTKHLVLGNWEEDLTSDRGAWKRAGFATVTTEQVLEMGGVNVRLSHRPLVGCDELVLHGHTHRKAKVSGPKSIHVGWDAWRRYVPEIDIITTIESLT